jgi:phosphate transport system permease protein
VNENPFGRLAFRRRAAERAGRFVMGGAALLALGILAWLLTMIFVRALPGLNLHFIVSVSTSRAATTGVLPALLGTLWLGALSMLAAIPLGIAAAVYLNEFARPNAVTSLLRASIANLAGVPSIVFGILGLALFVRAMHLGASLTSAGLTLGLLTLPIVIVVSEEALKTVPNSIREAAYGVGASRWQAVRHHVLPYSLPGMLTGSILALARTMGETAPLIVIGAAAYISYLPTDPSSRFTALPMQAYKWALHHDDAFHTLAWASVFILIVLVLIGNLTAILLRDRFQRKYRW